ncbi:MAG TPA: T9SS type A sorting domain-containing protein [Bacteroidales bacterium]|mgnify:CR=1 FL=1|nr:T9SS type A sorting domain-containing protein [Bacteroidales bacterium]
MKIFIVSLFVLMGFQLVAQNFNVDDQPMRLPLTAQEQSELSSLPELKLPEAYKNKSLPVEVDNSTLPYHCGLFEQSGNECGQATSVANAFTYEIDRLRDVAADVPENRYPTHFAWNWENGGYGWYGASYYHTLKLLKTVGTPNVQTYGGEYDTGGSSRFMTGYDNYYAGMHNRIGGAAAIKCDTEEGILTVKNWLNDHLDGSETGGVGFFYSQYQSISHTLPAGSPHEGENAIISWDASPNHAMCIIGYNDSVRYDYNGDGQFTNDIDITGDDIVDVRDWEIGAFKMVNNYSTPYYAWMMYRTLAMESDDGGIWNHTVNIMYALRDYSPVLTYKVNLYYSNRGRLKILTGFSTDLDATSPDYYLSFPIFDYQGGELPMQGQFGDAYKYIEFGLDVTPMLNLINPGTPIKLFFMVLENDNWGLGSGRIVNFSVMDYSSGNPVEAISEQTDVSIANNGVTSVALIHVPEFDKPEITPEALPDPVLNQAYSQQLSSVGGTPPYRYEFNIDYKETENTEEAPDVNTPVLDTYVQLPFEFEFYGVKYHGININANGYIDFSNEPYALPYNDNSTNQLTVSFLHRKCIAAFMSSVSCSTFYSEGTDYCLINWTGTDINTTLKLESSGTITVYYNDCKGLNGTVWISGVSNGNLENYTLSPLSGLPGNVPVTAYSFHASLIPQELQLAENGLLSGLVTDEALNSTISVKVTDSRGLTDVKNYQLFSAIPLESFNDNAVIVISPNPAGEFISVYLPGHPDQAGRAEIFNLSGAVVCEKLIYTISDNTIEITDMPPGQYKLKISCVRKVFIKKFIKL